MEKIKLYPKCDADEFGYVDIDGNFVIEPKFEYADSEFSESVANVGQSEIYGYIDCLGNWVIKGQFEEAGPFNDGVACILPNMDHMRGFINKLGEWIFQPKEEFDLGVNCETKFVDGIAIICDAETELWGAIDKKGEFVIKPSFNSASNFSEGMARVVTKDGTGFIDGKGVWCIEPSFEAGKSFEENLAAVKINGKWGYVNHNGEWVIKPVFDEAESFRNDIAKVCVRNKWGLIKKDGSFFVRPKYASLELRNNGLAKVSIKNKYGYIDIADGCELIKPIYAEINDFCNGLACVKIKKKYGYINREGELVISPQFEYDADFSNGFACVYVNSKYGYMDLTGNWIIEPKFDEANSFSNGLARVKIQEADGWKYGYINTSGELLANTMFEDMGYFFEDRLAVKLHGKCGYIDREGKWIVEPKYDFTEDFFNRIGKVHLGDNIGYVDHEGRLVRRLLNWYDSPSDEFDKKYDGICPCWANDEGVGEAEFKQILKIIDHKSDCFDDDELDDEEYSGWSQVKGISEYNASSLSETAVFADTLGKMRPEGMDVDPESLRQYVIAPFINFTPLEISTKLVSSKVKFELDTDSPELTLKASGEIYEAIEAGGYEGALLKEIKSCLANTSFYMSWGATEDNLEISLDQYPQLIQLLPGIPSISTLNGMMLEWSNGPAKLELHIEQVDDVMVAPKLCLIAGDSIFEAPRLITSNYALIGNTIYTFEEVGSNYKTLSSLIQPFPDNLLEYYLSLFMTYVRNIMPVYKGIKAIMSTSEIQPQPTLVFEDVAEDMALYMRLVQTVEGEEPFANSGVATLSKRAVLTDGDSRVVIYPVASIDLTPAYEIVNELLEKSYSLAKKTFYPPVNASLYIIDDAVANIFLYTYLPHLLKSFKVLGAKKLMAYKITPSVPRIDINFTSGIDFLEGTASIEIGDESFNLSDFLTQWQTKRYIELSDGSRAVVEDKYIRALQRIFRIKPEEVRTTIVTENEIAEEDNHVSVSVFDLPELCAILGDDNAKLGKVAEKFRNILRGFNTLKDYKLDELPINATLRPYQIDGVKWIKYLYDNHIGGCLADDMGLGKTIQTISVLAMACAQNKLPNLIVMPRSLLFNWQNELQRFAPQITVATYYGAARKLPDVLNAQVILTTYTVVRKDIDSLEEVNFNYVVLDESQNIKNVSAQTTQAVVRLKAERRLALSGTPIENNLLELYSLFEFLNPGMFGPIDNFISLYIGESSESDDGSYSNEYYDKKTERLDGMSEMAALRRKINPFILRRTKKEVLVDLPDRINQTIYVDMSPRQAIFYEKRRRMYDAIRKEAKKKGIFLLQAMNELRQIASVPENLTDGAIQSAKFERLNELIIASVANGHKTVVFFNYLSGIEIIGKRLKEAGIGYEIMTGSTSTNDRKEIVGRFQNKADCMVLLMTLKVGGVGLNLTAADTVFIAEPWWNKAAENQAIDRLHRIGQKSTVNAYSLITRGTIEEKIALLQQQKQDLFDDLLSTEGTSLKNLTEEDINFILS